MPPLATIGTRQQPARVSDGLIATPLRTLRPQISDPRHPNLTLRYKVPLDPGLRTDYGRARAGSRPAFTNCRPDYSLL